MGKSRIAVKVNWRISLGTVCPSKLQCPVSLFTAADRRAALSVGQHTLPYQIYACFWGISAFFVDDTLLD
jgi:hypothetical protein